ncbi:MAG: hypothetical protein N0A00_01610 [Candidatus Bathyarchaeota archaeon]|nr:hypothetical protein [Candidatus Bathyarchaeota archaeon]
MKHKLEGWKTEMARRITDDSEFNKIVGSIQTKTIQKLLLVWYNVFHDYVNSPVAAEVLERAREKQPHLKFTLRNLAWSLQPGDVAEMLKISKKQAREYIKFFRIIYMEQE